MNQQQLEALLAQMGALGPNDFREETKQEDIPNPASTANGGLDPNAPLTVKGPVTYRTWVKPGTNQRLTVKVNTDGTYTQAFSGADPDIKSPATTTRTPEQQATDAATAANTTELQRQRERNAALPADQDPAYETDAERRTRADARIKQQGADAKAAEDKARQDALDQERRDKEAAATAERNKPKPQQAPDGSWGYFDVSKNPPVWTPIANAPGAAAPKPVQVNGQWGVWQPNASDPKQPPSFVTIEVPKPGVTLKNVDAWEPDFAQPDLGIGTWAASQRQRIGLPAEQGGITQDDYDNSVKDVLGRAGTTISNVTSATTVVRQQQIDTENRRKTRSDEASSDFSTALGALTGLKGFDPDSGAIRQVVPGIMWELNNARREREGQAPPPPALHPMFQIASANAAATAQPPAAKDQEAGTGPAPAPYQPPTSELGQPGDPTLASTVTPAFTPQPPVNLAGGAPVVPPPPPGAAMAPPPAAPPAVSAPAMAAPPQSAPPPAAPNPNVGQPGDPMMPPAISPSTGEPTGLAPLPENGQFPQQPMTPPAAPAQIWEPAAPLPPPPINMDPSQGPVGQGQGGPLSAFASNALAPAAPPAPAPTGQPGPMDGLMQGMGEGFDPVARAAELERMGVPHEAVVAALTQSGLLKRMPGMRGAA